MVDLKDCLWSSAWWWHMELGLAAATSYSANGDDAGDDQQQAVGWLDQTHTG
jgi:hypothetical protein